MGILGNLFGGGKSNVGEYLETGAVVIDVRSAGEYQGGHVEGSKNIPLQSIESNLNKIKKMNKQVVLCCASGMRSGQATSILKREGVDCINGGSWVSVNNHTVSA